MYAFVIPACLTNALCEQASAGGLCTSYRQRLPLPLVATRGYS